MWSFSRMIISRENRSSTRKTCPSDIMSITNPTWIYLWIELWHWQWETGYFPRSSNAQLVGTKTFCTMGLFHSGTGNMLQVIKNSGRIGQVLKFHVTCGVGLHTFTLSAIDCRIALCRPIPRSQQPRLRFVMSKTVTNSLLVTKVIVRLRMLVSTFKKRFTLFRCISPKKDAVKVSLCQFVSTTNVEWFWLAWVKSFPCIC